MAEQPRLFTFLVEDRSAAALLVTESNRAAWDRLQRWREWPGHALALSGPQGAGKSHMALAWAEQARAGVCWPQDRAMDVFERFGGRVVVDDADRYPDEPHLALLLDAARYRPGAAVLLVGRDLPDAWPAGLVDLRSRLAAMPVVEVGQPDDAMLAGVLERLCRARFMKLTEKAARYLVHHMERSFAAAHAVTDALDRIHVRGARPVSVGVAAKALRSIWAEAPEPDAGEAALDAQSEDV
jgi:chromosomal replication initiation ATPase DnaA